MLICGLYPLAASYIACHVASSYAVDLLLSNVDPKSSA